MVGPVVESHYSLLQRPMRHVSTNRLHCDPSFYFTQSPCTYGENNHLSFSFARFRLPVHKIPRTRESSPAITSTTKREVRKVSSAVFSRRISLTCVFCLIVYREFISRVVFSLFLILRGYSNHRNFDRTSSFFFFSLEKCGCSLENSSSRFLREHIYLYTHRYICVTTWKVLMRDSTPLCVLIHERKWEATRNFITALNFLLSNRETNNIRRCLKIFRATTSLSLLSLFQFLLSLFSRRVRTIFEENARTSESAPIPLIR